MATPADRYLEQLLAAHQAKDAFVQDAEDEAALDDETC
jgi:hypothetical protein